MIQLWLLRVERGICCLELENLLVKIGELIGVNWVIANWRICCYTLEYFLLYSEVNFVFCKSVKCKLENLLV